MSLFFCLPSRAFHKHLSRSRSCRPSRRGFLYCVTVRFSFVCVFYLAFDPAYPGFDGPNARRRLAKSDAKFVDVIHTNARTGLSNAVGIETPLGHADFYPNGGSRMPGCIGFSFQTSKKFPMRPIRNLIWRFCLINDGF